MLRPTSRLASGRSFAASMARWRLATEISPKPSSPRTWSQSIEKMSPMSWMSPSSRNSRTLLLAEALDVQRAAGREVLDRPVRPGTGTGGRRSGCRSRPRAAPACSPRGHGQVVGNAHGLERFGRSASTGPTTSGMTSPARRTITVSPGRTSLARTWSSLCRVAWPTLAPPTNTGSSRANGRGPAGAADRHEDVEQLGGALLGRELVGDGPARRPAREAELAPPAEVVDLHDHAVDLVVEVVAVLLPVLAVRLHLVEVRQHA